MLQSWCTFFCRQKIPEFVCAPDRTRTPAFGTSAFHYARTNLAQHLRIHKMIANDCSWQSGEHSFGQKKLYTIFYSFGTSSLQNIFGYCCTNFGLRVIKIHQEQPETMFSVCMCLLGETSSTLPFAIYVPASWKDIMRGLVLYPNGLNAQAGH